MKKLLLLPFFLLILIPFLGSAQTGSIDSVDHTIPTINIDQNGNATINGMKVWQLAGRSLFTRTSWDKSFIRWLVKTDGNTIITKRYGDPMSVYDIKAGDYLSIEGTIESGDSLSIKATKITDWSNYESLSRFSGSVVSVASDLRSFSLLSGQYGTIQVNLSASTTIERNRREITARYIYPGDKILSITGTFDHQTKNLDASEVVVYINPSIFSVMNYQGTLKTKSGNTLPVNLVMNINGRDYKVNLSSDASVLNKARQSATLDRFIAGDSVRVYGFIRQDNDDLDTINASVIRNISF